MRPLTSVRAAALAALALAFLPTLASYPNVWADQPYTHGWLIAVAAVWLVWRERDVFEEPVGPSTAALVGAIAASLLWLVATIVGAGLLSQLALPVLLLLWATAAFGTRAGRRLAPIAAIFLLAVPFWGPVFTRPLQSLTILVSGTATSLLRIPATIEGDAIHTPVGSFMVESGCSGLNYFMSGLTLGVLYGHIVSAGTRLRVALVGIAAGLAIVGNWIRVSGLVAVGYATEMQSILVTQRRPHLIYGWSIFTVGLVIFFLIAGMLVRRAEGRAKPSTSSGDSAARVPVTPSLSAPRLRPIVLATAAALAGPFVYHAVRALPLREAARSELQAGSLWQARALERPYGWKPEFTGSNVQATQAWTDNDRSVFIDRFVYHEQSRGAELIGYSSRIAPDSLVLSRRILLTPGYPRRVVNEAIVADEGSPLLVWYWYRVGGIETGSGLRAKLLEILAFFRRIQESELIAVSTPCEPTSCMAASETLSSFLGSS